MSLHPFLLLPLISLTARFLFLPLVAMELQSQLENAHTALWAHRLREAEVQHMETGSAHKVSSVFQMLPANFLAISSDSKDCPSSHCIVYKSWWEGGSFGPGCCWKWHCYQHKVRAAVALSVHILKTHK